jgi:hypothetical protein
MKGYQHVGLRSAPLFRESLPWPETGLMLRLALGRPGRHTEGLLGSIMGLLGWIWRPLPVSPAGSRQLRLAHANSLL